MKYSTETIAALRKSVKKWEIICEDPLIDNDEYSARESALSLCELCFDRLGIAEHEFSVKLNLDCTGCPMDPVDCCRDGMSIWSTLWRLDWDKHPDVATALCQKMLSTLQKILDKCETDDE